MCKASPWNSAKEYIVVVLTALLFFNALIAPAARARAEERSSFEAALHVICSNSDNGGDAGNSTGGSHTHCDEACCLRAARVDVDLAPLLLIASALILDLPDRSIAPVHWPEGSSSSPGQIFAGPLGARAPPSLS